MKAFYMVYCNGGSSPQKRHDTLEAAQAEAARLTNVQKNDVFVLKAIQQVAPKLDVIITQLED